MRNLRQLLAVLLCITLTGWTSAQSENLTLNFTGGGCDLCGQIDYACNTGPYSGDWSPRLFMDPLPGNTVITTVAIEIWGAFCYNPGQMSVMLNGELLELIDYGQTSCDCGTCNQLLVSSSCAHLLYNYGAMNSLFLMAEGTICIDRIEVTLNYVVCDLAVDAGADQTVFYGYDPMATADLNATIVGGTAPLSIEWYDQDNNSAGSGASISVSPSATTDYLVVVTDANGCTATDQVRVCVIDVVCGNNGDKVALCHNMSHNPRTICISAEDVGDHLDHGDALGSCEAQAGACGAEPLVIQPPKPEKKAVAVQHLKVESFNQAPAAGFHSAVFSFTTDGTPAISVSQNPVDRSYFITFGTLQDSYASIQLLNAQGGTVSELFTGRLTGGETQDLRVSTSDLPAGIYICSMRVGEQTTQRKLVVTR